MVTVTRPRKPIATSYVCGSCGSHLKPPSASPTATKVALTLPPSKPRAASADTATALLTLTANPQNAKAWSVNLDGTQLGLTAGKPSTQSIAAGDHILTAFVWGDAGASITVTGTIPGKKGVTCSCRVVNGDTSAADPEPFTI